MRYRCPFEVLLDHRTVQGPAVRPGASRREHPAWSILLLFRGVSTGGQAPCRGMATSRPAASEPLRLPGFSASVCKSINKIFTEGLEKLVTEKGPNRITLQMGPAPLRERQKQ